ncbi:MAG: OmpA family protein [Myxococcota bacterium]
MTSKNIGSLTVSLAISSLLGAMVLWGAPVRASNTDDFTRETNTVEIGVFGGVLLPSKAHELYDFGTVAQTPFDKVNPEMGLRIAYFPLTFLGAEIEGAYSRASTDLGTAHVWSPRGHLVVQVPRRLSPFLLAGGGWLGVNSSRDILGDDVDPAFHWGGGVKFAITPRIALRLDGRHIISAAIYRGPGSDDRAHHFEALAGLSVLLGQSNKDKDKDGVVNEADQCPMIAGVLPTGCPDEDRDAVADKDDRCPQQAGRAEHQGCPDADEDSVADDKDLCPTQTGVAPHGCPDTDGDGFFEHQDKCPLEAGIAPDGCPDLDADKDGVLLPQDLCPEVAGPEPTGCPPEDPDGDGVAGDADKCPNTAGTLPNGCPDLDPDRDGVPIDVDQCPETPETVNGYMDNDGCPDEVPEEIKKFTGTIKGITFKTGSAVIKPESYPVLDQAIAILKEFPDLRLEISGHTDSSGKARTNKRISTKRATSVRTYFVSKGIAANRLVAKGYGEDAPIASNATKQGRAGNRRIEFKLIP